MRSHQASPKYEKPRRVVPYLWSIYVVYYLLRFSLAGSALFLIKEGRISLVMVGWVYSCFFAAYAIGQLVAGYTADHYSPQRLLRFGLIGSVITNILSYFCLAWDDAHHVLVLLLWVLNGLFQSMGWAPITKIMSWHCDKEYSSSASVVSTSFLWGASISWLLSAGISRFWSWEQVFLLPAAIGFLFWLLTTNLIFDVRPSGGHLDFKGGIRVLCISRPAIAAFIGVNTIRYYIFDWLPILLSRETRDSLNAIMIKVLIYPLSGLLGVWIGRNLILRRQKSYVDRTWSLSLLMMFILAIAINCLMAILDSYILLFLIALGMTTAGAHFYTVAIAPKIIDDGGNIATTTGLVESSGYLGQAVGNIVIAWIISTHGKLPLSLFFAGLCFIILLANLGGRNENNRRT